MINDILDMAKIESGRFGLREDVFDPVDTAIDIVRMFMPEMKERQLQFRICGIRGEEVPYVRADERHMRQILLNLLSNAVKFTPPGGRIDLCTLRHENGDLSIIVEDTGAGIPAHMVERVFEPFEQVECSFTRKTSGTGLGLPLARAMMEAHDGTLTLTSEEGKGTRVMARLPAERVVQRKAAALRSENGNWPGVLTA
jgi:two-component system cell cycle sensor histidine kinase PleC